MSLDEGMRVKLKSEVVSPFRRFRQFILFGVLASAGLGTFTAVPQLLITLNNPENPKIPLETAYQNVAVDVLGLLGSAYFLFKDFTTEAETIEKFTEREKKATEKLTSSEATEQEDFLSQLPVEIQINEKDENVTRVVPLGDLQSKGKQNVIIVTGKKAFVKDAVISARIEGVNLFTEYNTMVVPVISEQEEQLDDIDKKLSKGFGAAAGKEEMLSAPYFGKPMQVNVWLEFLKTEIKKAENQGTKNALKEGLVLVLNRNGKVTRRGLGLPPWKVLVDELENAERQAAKKKLTS